MSRRQNRFDIASGKPSRIYIIFVAAMVALLVLGSVALIGGTAFDLGGDDDGDPSLDVREGEEIQRLQTTIAENPDDTESMAVLANILANSGQLEDAVGWYEPAVMADPDNGDLRVAFALALYQLGNDFDAAVQFRRAAELLPDSATPPFYLGQIEERAAEPDLEVARALYEQAIGIAPDSLVGQQAQTRLDQLDDPTPTATP